MARAPHPVIPQTAGHTVRYLTFPPLTAHCAPPGRAASGSGRYIKFLTAVGAAWRFATFFRRKNRFFDAQGVLKHE